MRAKQWTRWVGVLLTLTIGTVAQAATWIEDFEGTPEAYRLKRDGQELPVKIYQTLQPGDRLWVLEAGHSLWLRRDDGSEVIISQKNSPYRVEVVGKAPGRWANLFAWASDWLTGQLNEGATRSVVSVVTRGEIPPITLPLIAEEPARLVAGRRPLHLAWRGGYPPFRVRLVAEEGERVVLDRQRIELEGNQEWRFSTAPLEWVPGRYLLTIDDGWRQAEVALMVVPEEQLPAPPEELAGGVEHNVRETLYALWLAAQGEEWLLEAYQRAVGLAERHPPAEILMQSLEQDQQPPLPARAEAGEGASLPSDQEDIGMVFIFIQEEAALMAELDHLNQQGTSAYYRANYQDALAAWEVGLAKARATDQQQWVGSFLGNLGLVYNNLGQYPKALEYYQQALAIHREIGDRHGEGFGLGSIGVVYWNLGQYPKALEYYQQALAIHREIGDRHGEGNVLNNSGNVYSSLGQYPKALEYYQQALAVHREIGDRHGEGDVLNNFGVVYRKLSQYAKALEHHEQGLAIHRELGDRHGEGDDLSNIGAVYWSLGQYLKALTYFEQALAIRREIGDRNWEGNDLANIGVVYWNLGQYAKVLEHYGQALAIRREIGDRGGEGNDLTNIGIVYDNLGQYLEALEHYEQALAIQSEVGAPESLWRVWNGLCLVLTQQNQPEAAIFAGKQAVNTLQAMREHIQTLEQDLQKSFLENKESVYWGLADLLIEQGRLPEAQQVLGMLKEEEYFDFIRRDAKARSRLDSQIAFNPIEVPYAERYRQISGELVALGKEYQELRQAARLRELSEQEQTRREALDADLKLAHQAFQSFLAELQAELKQVSKERLAEISEKQLEYLRNYQRILSELGHGAVLVHYLITDEALHIILTTPGVQLARSVALSAGDLHRDIHALREALQDARSDPLSAAQTLYAALIKPIAEDLEQAGARTLMVSLDGALRYIPLATLHDGERYLAERYAVALYTEAAKMALEHRPRPDWNVAGLGVSKAMAEFPPLVAVTSELDGIVRQSEADRDGVLPGEIHLDEAFTADALDEALFQGYSVVHIASHFRFQPGGTDDDSYLLLGDGQTLSLAQVRDENLDFAEVELLTLSACETGLGAAANRGGAGREVEGLGALAQQQGARSVIATLWQVADVGTGEFMRRFYEKRAEGLTKTEALRQVQEAFIQGGDALVPGAERGKVVDLSGSDAHPSSREAREISYPHPYFWAPFILMGNWL